MVPGGVYPSLGDYLRRLFSALMEWLVERVEDLVALLERAVQVVAVVRTWWRLLILRSQ